MSQHLIESLHLALQQNRQSFPSLSTAKQLLNYSLAMQVSVAEAIFAELSGVKLSKK